MKRLYGLIGNPLSHSFSKKYFSEKFERSGLSDCEYELFPLPAISALPLLLERHPGLCGLNVTIPYKEQVLPYVHSMDEVVSGIRASNCIRVVNGKLFAFNTDVIGFEKSLLAHWNRPHKKALILGTGGAAKAVKYVLEKLDLDVKSVSRNPGGSCISYEEVTESVLKEYTLVVNTTPLGMSPATDLYPPLPYQVAGRDHYFFDVVYNPEKTAFLRKAEQQGAVICNGHEMLTIQAEESWKIWNADPQLFVSDIKSAQ